MQLPGSTTSNALPGQSQLDEFILNVLGNDEVIAVNQDALGKQASTILHDGDLRVLRTGVSTYPR